MDKNLTMLPRTLSEANRDAEYATAITRPHSEWEDIKNFAGGAVLISPFVLGALYVLHMVWK